MVLHTLIENAIKHHHQEHQSVICIEARIAQTEAGLALDVADNGPGIADVARAMNNGVGLSNLKARLEGLYGDRHQFEISNRPDGGLQVHVGIPLEPKPALQCA